MIDPRLIMVRERLARARRVIAVGGGKGGVGKSLVASTLALTLSRQGLKTGLIDLDFTNPTDHLILGYDDELPGEGNAILPKQAENLKLMSIAFYSKKEAIPLRGRDVSNALIELLANTEWGELDFLIIDLPPGLTDALLDVLRLSPRTEFILVGIDSVLSEQAVSFSEQILKSYNAPHTRVINMSRKQGEGFRIPFDPLVESALGKPDALLGTLFSSKIRELASIIQNLNTKK